MSDADDPAWAWVAHLRDGGTTPWREWCRAPVSAPAPVGRRVGRLPGAAQLEVVRRLAGRPAAGGLPDFTAVADRALHRPGPGRGLPLLPLLRPGLPDDPDSVPPVGAPPIDPEDVPAEELLRIAVGLLVELLLDLGPTEEPERPRHRLLGRRFHLAGAPVSTAAVRSALVAAGHVEGGRRPEVLLLVEPLDVALAQVWSARVQRGAPVRWLTFVRRWARRDELPPSMELPRIAAHWADRVGAHRVHLLADPHARRTAAEVLGLRSVPPAAAPARRELAGLAPSAVDLLRRTNRVLNVRVPADQRAGHLRRLAGLLPGDGAPALDVPAAHRRWVDDRAHRISEELRAGGYAVHGDLDRIVPRHEGAAHPRRPEVLELVLDTCLALAELQTRRGREGADR